MRLIAQSQSYGGAIFWSMVLLGLCIVTFFLVSFARKWMRGDADDGPVTGFTLADLRELHRNGKMSDEEFERAKAKLLEATRAAASKTPPAGSAADTAKRRYDPPIT